MLKRLALDGFSPAYVDEGTGAPVLFLHPTCTDHRVWEAQRTEFSRHYRFMAYDQRYFGTAPWPDKGEHFSVATFADDLAAFIRALNVGPVHLVGWSYSGGAILNLAVRQPELVKSLFIFEPAISTFIDDLDAAKRAAADRQAIFDAAATLSDVRAFMDAADGQTGSFDRLPAAIRAMMLDNARMLPLLFAAPRPPTITCGQLAQLAMPTAIARGERTRPYYRLCTDAAARCIPGCRAMIIPGARHLWPAHEPAGFNAAVRAWLGL